MIKFNRGVVNKEMLDAVKNDIEKNGSNDQQNCFVTKPVNQWINEAKSRPIPKMLFGRFWYEGEVCILFADTNVGKSVLAVQIADSISRQKPIAEFPLEVVPQRTIYLDFELSDKQFEKRYSNNYSNHYQFSDNFLRTEINVNHELPKSVNSFEEFVVLSLKQEIKLHSPKVIIIDNITYLRSDNERAKDALSLMKELKAIAKEFKISVLVLAHTPKRDSKMQLSKNDLAGSKMLINFCDSAFAIGQSQKDKGLRYIKQIKQRNTECVYHSGNVVIFELKQKFNFLMFDFIGYDDEINHLSESNLNEKQLRNQCIADLHKQGLSNCEIARQLDISEGTVRYQLNKL
ncbi:AAA family ATPase [Meridianimaribacter flavus]|uniref:Regulatory LuxR family protein n=1 Tax=Meridianimaribacter flavus TaxID=571115 RepID=A0ABY2G9M4_9FLAO|nr:AAA family ATPase [Meridianimaribacter flavus]TDY14145.1 regulatory LuxR family protein [Meridianimaribacter flavus]